MLIWVFLIFLGLIASKSKIITILDVIFFIISSGLRTQGGDYVIYVNEYRWAPYQTSADVKYPGFLKIEQFTFDHGINFEHFLILVAIIGFILMIIGVYQVTDNPNTLLSLYMLYPFGHDAIQMKTFTADAIIIFALPLILKLDLNNKKKIDTIKILIYFLLCIIAASIQYSIIFYGIIAIIYIFVSNKYQLKTLIAVDIVSILLIYSGILPRMLSNLDFRGSSRNYITLNTRFGMLFPIILTILIYCISQKTIELSKKNGLIKINNINIDNYQKYIQCILILIPLFCLDITYNRLWRIFLILIYSLMSKFIHLKRIDTNHKLNLGSSLVAIILVLMLYEREFNILLSFLTHNAFIN